MQVTETLSEGLKHEFKISVPASDLDAKADAKLVDLKDTIASFKAILGGEGDALPENAFYMVGDFASAKAKGEKILAELEQSS